MPNHVFFPSFLAHLAFHGRSRHCSFVLYRPLIARWGSRSPQHSCWDSGPPGVPDRAVRRERNQGHQVLAGR